MLLNHPFELFYIGHLIDPFLFYCLTGNYFLPILIPFLWEIFEHIMFSTASSYVFYLEVQRDDIVRESFDDILIYDMGFAVLGVLSGYMLFKAMKLEPVFEAKCNNQTLLFVFRALILSVPSSVSWTCPKMIEHWCEDGYNVFPWGLIVIMLVDILYIVYMWKDRKDNVKWYILLFCLPVFVSAMQRTITGAFVTLIYLGVFNILCILYILCIKCKAQRQFTSEISEISEITPKSKILYA